ncbi:hypothetical protein M5D96_004349 [Drosophila gunungcola]|uniref:Uncharacterized protein n=1 Tax=Drosophila gunungcola TaxID=103775 RepID=A0A9Q0BTA5_9MUSC|nr:hypothetical protein M5D96_004349 [Drosophila gunungcola]
MMRDRLASLIVVKQEGGSNTNISHHIGHHHQPAIKCEASLYESGSHSLLFQEINNNSCYRQNLNTPAQQQQQQQQHTHQQQQQHIHQQHLLPPPLPPLIYPCRNLFPDGCDINHLACCSSSNSTSNSTNSTNSTTSNSPNNSHFFANGNTVSKAPQLQQTAADAA